MISIVREEEKHLISIEQMRDMLKDVYRSPSLGTKKFVLLEDAHELSVGAANAFLKTLEEPPASAVFFLTSHRPSRLLPTIISRCQVIELVQQAADSDNEERETEKQLFSDFLGLSAGDRINIIAEHFKKKTPHAQASIVWDRRLIYWQEFLRDQLIEQAGQKNIMLNQKLVQSIDLLEEIRRDLGFHVNLRARLEHFAISL